MLSAKRVVLSEDGFVKELTNPERNMDDELLKFFCRTHHEPSLITSLSTLDLDTAKEVLKATTTLLKTMLSLTYKDLKLLSPAQSIKTPSIANAISFATALVDAQFANFLTDASDDVVSELLGLLESYNETCKQAELVDGVLCHINRTRKGKQQSDVIESKTVEVLQEKRISKQYSVETIKLL
eukprot:m.34903 g.34903  ORF g.34903 m.34903 type:complete len:183 (-) comp9965_c1_seq1:257-805(-)